MIARHILRRSMMRIPYLPTLLAVAAVAYSTAGAQSDNHTVRVSVAVITALKVSSGTVNLTITGAGVIAGQDLMTVVDQSTSLLWGTNSSGKKVTVQSNLASPKYTLKVEALGPTQGTAAGQVVLSSVARDFLLNIGRSSGTCSIRYVGEALASQGAGSDAHTITFTIANQ